MHFVVASELFQTRDHLYFRDRLSFYSALERHTIAPGKNFYDIITISVDYFG